MELCFVYGSNYKSLRESCKFYRFRARAAYTPCTSRVHGRVRAVYTCNGRVRTRPVYTAVYVYGPCTCVDGPHTAVDTARVHGRCTRPCTGGVHGGVHDRVRIRPVYTVVYTCLHDSYTAVGTVRVHSRVCTRSCRRHVHGRYTALHGRLQVLNTAVYTARTRTM